MGKEELRLRLMKAKSLEEVKEIAASNPEINAEQARQEITNHQSGKSQKLDLDELDAVSGGADRDWPKDGCAATCEWNSWCMSNDYCVAFSVTYDGFWETCPDGHQHEWDNTGYNCTRCGYFSPRKH